MTKTCIACKEDKEISEFPPNKSRKDGLNTKCRLCFNDYMKSWYAKNKEVHMSRTAKVKQTLLENTRDFIWNYLVEHPCEKCGENDPVVLEFDHLDQSQKSFGIHEMMARGHSLENIRKEIAKCRVLCCNCHRRRTAEQLNWWRKSR